jgi:creatinine amidohydrolase/Fe(II)-dependent formamide hydrolase-like protein
MDEGISAEYGVKIFSIGASNEEHGPAIPWNFDDFYAKRVCVAASERLRADYRMHLPYSSDGLDLARRWNRTFIPREELVNRVVSDIKQDIKRMNDPFSAVAVFSGHGGNNFLKQKETEIKERTGVPFIYVPPLSGLEITHPEYGTITPMHAGDCEHSLAAYFGMIDEKGLKDLNEVAAKSVDEIMRRWPAILLLGYLDGETSYPVERIEAKKRSLEKGKIIADPEVGRKFFEMDLENVVSAIRDLIANV